MKDKGVVLSQRKRVGGEFVQRGIFQPERRLDFTAPLLLAEDIGNVVSAESPRRMRFGNRGRYRFRAVFTDQREQLAVAGAHRPPPPPEPPP